VTGGGSGDWQSRTLQFAREAGKVVVVDLNDQHGNETVQEITRAEKPPSPSATDQVKSAVKWTKIDVLVNDAAMMTFQPIVDLPDYDFDKVLNVNLRSVFLFCSIRCRTCRREARS
jgi:NAD(P)-dependent dehydrogenase (short-subunit alcohol dehydrogenase family)